MRLVLLANDIVGLQVCEWLKEQNEDIVGLVVHPSKRQKYGHEIIAASGLLQSRVIESGRLHDQASFEFLQALEPELMVSAWYGYILKPEVIDLAPLGCINMHGSYLPYNRGRRSNVFSIVEESPAGVSIHYIDEGIDTGDVIARRLVEIEPIDTGETLFRKEEVALFEVFKESWPAIKDGSNARTPQSQLGVGNHHYGRDVEKIDHIDLSRSYVAKDLVNILRARTFPPYPSAYFLHEGRRVYMRLSLEYGPEDGGGGDE